MSAEAFARQRRIEENERDTPSEELEKLGVTEYFNRKKGRRISRDLAIPNPDVNQAELDACKCTTKCTSTSKYDSWCFVDSKCKDKLATSVRGPWRYCNADIEPFKMSRTELIAYWSKKAPEILENLRPLNRLMITLGHRAQAEKKRGRQEVLKLKNVRLYHPIRGPGERAPAIASLDARRDALLEAAKQGWISYNPETKQTLIDKLQRPLTQRDLDRIPVMRSKDLIQVVKLEIDPKAKPICSSDLIVCDPLFPIQYLCVSGQGRFLAMKEAFLDKEHWTEFQVELEVFDLQTALCQEMVSVHNEYIAQHLLLSEYAFQASTCELGAEEKKAARTTTRPTYHLAPHNAMTVKQLRSELRVRGLSTTGKQSQLKSRLLRARKSD